MSGYILTYTKTKFYPLEPKKEDIYIEDIAHALSLMTRANGHFSHFYSVGQHCLNCFREAKSRGYSERVQLGCLLHDASEGYISDLTRPVKCEIPEYFVIEERLQRMIYEKFGLCDLKDEELEQINEVDDALLHFEFEELMEYQMFEKPPYKTMEHDFALRDFKSVEKEYLSIFNRLTKEKKGFSCVGVDGCKLGWVAVNITDSGFEVDIYKSIEEICLKYYDSDSIIIDMPMGLPENDRDIRPDSAARSILFSKASSIFNTPCRQAVYAEGYYEANAFNKQILGKGLSKQSYAISNKIREIDEFLDRHPEYKNIILEGHPEVSFTMLNFGRALREPIYENKKTEEGVRKRVELLSHYYNRTDEIIGLAESDNRLKRFMDDVIDALCLAVTGTLGLEKRLKSIPEMPMADSRGILMQIVYAEGTSF